MSTWQEKARDAVMAAIAGATWHHHRYPANGPCKHCIDSWAAVDAALDALAPVVEDEVRRGQVEALREAASNARLALSNGVSGHTSTYFVRKWLHDRADAIEAGDRR